MASTLLNLSLLALTLLTTIPVVEATPCPKAFTHQGCFVGTVNGRRILDSASFASDDMTIGSCSTFCADKNFQYFGVEYGRECYCGNDAPANTPVDPSECSFPCPGDGPEATGKFTCGAGNRLDLYLNNHYIRPTVAELEDVPYVGCFVDDGPRVLPDNVLSADDMTATKCADHCAGFFYFGLEFGRECWCGNSAPLESAQTTEGECSFTCSGNFTEICGAGERINVWGPVSPKDIGGYEYTGCYTDRGDARSLSGRTEFRSDMTQDQCAAFCDGKGYPIFGVEFGTQCFCSVTVAEGAELVDAEECAMACGGDRKQKCGDANRLNVWSKPEGSTTPPSNPATAGNGTYAYKSCWTDDVNDRSLTGPVHRHADMTVEKCAGLCGAGAFAYFGVEFTEECFCGNELGGAAAAAETECAQLCGGNPTEFCGGPGRMNVYAAVVPEVEEPETETEPVVEGGDEPEGGEDDEPAPSSSSSSSSATPEPTPSSSSSSSSSVAPTPTD